MNESAIDRRQLMLPDGYSELVLRLGGGFERWRIDEPAKREIMRASYVIGGRSHSVLTRSIGALRLAGVKLDPRALRTLIDVPLGEYRNSIVSFADLNLRALCDLEDAVANVTSAVSLANVLDRFFLRRLGNEIMDDPVVQPLLREIRNKHGALSILRWAREQAVDPRTLERRFIAAMGMAPKQYARIVRFNHSYHCLITRPSSSDRMHLESYYDQSHFTRDFKEFVSAPLLTWLARMADYRTSISDHLLERSSQLRA